MKTVPLNHGYSALVDDADYERVAQFRWRAQKKQHTDRVYAVRTEYTKAEGGGSIARLIPMHRFILGDEGK